ncbi:hypothetical protein KCP77_00145 [Salmonella enterica subsp. enterica]|nr:hypothetical protein KCP77_00145 [Salmonella enterica subsp. enterica]
MSGTTLTCEQRAKTQHLSIRWKAPHFNSKRIYVTVRSMIFARTDAKFQQPGIDQRNETIRSMKKMKRFRYMTPPVHTVI